MEGIMNSNHPIYHQGELHLQALSGVKKQADKLARMMVRDYLDEQQQHFYSSLNSLYVASIDKNNKPWASIMTGPRGFISVLNEKRIMINSTPLMGDVLNENIKHNRQLGFLGLEHHTRRRNRLAGELIGEGHSSLTVNVKQAFGNCPKYIQARESILIAKENSHYSFETFTRLNAESKALLSEADTFFISSYYPYDEKRAADISHRGGRPGFIKIENDQCFVFDDYSGNNFYMTLGNLNVHPYAGLLFINYKTADVWQFQCEVEIIETPEKECKRQLKLHIDEIRKLTDVLNLSWRFIDYSKFL